MEREGEEREGTGEEKFTTFIITLVFSKLISKHFKIKESNNRSNYLLSLLRPPTLLLNQGNSSHTKKEG